MTTTHGPQSLAKTGPPCLIQLGTKIVMFIFGFLYPFDYDPHHQVFDIPFYFSLLTSSMCCLMCRQFLSCTHCLLFNTLSSHQLFHFKTFLQQFLGFQPCGNDVILSHFYFFLRQNIVCVLRTGFPWKKWNKENQNKQPT